MIFRDKHERSLLPKFFLVLVLLGSIVISICLMFITQNRLPVWLKPYAVDGDRLRCILLAVCFAVYYIRLLITAFVFLQRKLFWVEAIAIANLMPIVFPVAAFRGGSNGRPVGVMEIIGLGLFFWGSYINTASEYSRYVWKIREENKGRLYTSGLFRYAVNINYFGDVVLFAGLALVTGYLALLVIPFIMFLNFAMVLVPLKDRYLRRKYGKAYDDYFADTKKLIPFVY